MFQLPDHICVRLQNIQAAAPNQAKISPDTNINKSLGTVVYPPPSPPPPPNQSKISPDTNINKSLGTVVYPSPSSSSTKSV